jgi:hypothetical protein
MDRWHVLLHNCLEPEQNLKFLLSRLLVTLGLFSFFGGAANHFSAYAKECSSSSSAQGTDTMGRED